MSNKKQLTETQKKILATTLALGLLATGTFAWQSFDQIALNETSGLPGDPGGRLHDDFDGSNKDIYIENYADIEEGLEVYARVRLSQYMEYGDGAGTLTDSATPSTYTTGSDIAILRGDKAVTGVTTPDINEKDTWDIYLYEGTESGKDRIRYYQKLNFGSEYKSNNGATIYMPTFNKDIDSQEADISGTLAGTDDDRFSGTDYDDYVKYSLGQTITADATYSLDSSVMEALGTNIVEETHAATSTLTGSVISMTEWEEKGSPIGNYWVYDTDGWAYWADAIYPQTATALLLDSLTTPAEPFEDWYYGIHVITEIATKGDWGNEDETTGMYQEGITEKGLALLNKIAGLTEE